MGFRYTDDTGDIVLQVEAARFLDASADAIRYAQPDSMLLTPVDNAPIVLHMLAGEIATGDSPLVVRFYYRVVPMTLP